MFRTEKLGKHALITLVITYVHALNLISLQREQRSKIGIGKLYIHRVILKLCPHYTRTICWLPLARKHFLVCSRRSVIETLAGEVA